jgi:hypothetical protein
MGTKLSRAGHVLDDGGRAVSGKAFSVARGAVAFGAGVYLVVWQDWQRKRDRYEIFGARLDSAGKRLAPGDFRIGSEQASEDPDVAFGAGGFLTVWSSRSPSNVYARLVRSGGQVVGAVPTTLSDPSQEGHRPRAAFDGANYLVIWDTGVGIFGARVSRTGTVLDKPELAISTYLSQAYAPAIAFDGTNYLVVWSEGRGDYPDIYGARVTPAGHVLDPGGFRIASAPQTQTSPDVAFGAGGYLVIWEDWRPDCCSVWGARVTKSGVVRDTNPIQVSGHSGGTEAAPAVAFDRKNFVVAWGQRSAEDDDIWGARVSPAGALLDRNGILVSTAREVRCIVPRVIGLRLAPAAKRIRAGHCNVDLAGGRAFRRTGVVRSQLPRGGAVRRRGFFVSIVLGPR